MKIRLTIDFEAKGDVVSFNQVKQAIAKKIREYFRAPRMYVGWTLHTKRTKIEEINDF